MLAARSGAIVPKRTVRPKAQICSGPIAYVGQDELYADIENLKRALKDVGNKEGFMIAAAVLKNVKAMSALNRPDLRMSQSEAAISLGGMIVTRSSMPTRHSSSSNARTATMRAARATPTFDMRKCRDPEILPVKAVSVGL